MFSFFWILEFWGALKPVITRFPGDKLQSFLSRTLEMPLLFITNLILVNTPLLRQKLFHYFALKTTKLVTSIIQSDSIWNLPLSMFCTQSFFFLEMFEIATFVFLFTSKFCRSFCRPTGRYQLLQCHFKGLWNINLW